MRCHILILTYLVLLIGCNHKKPNYKINRIVFASGGCFGSCPIQVIDIDSMLQFKYHGVKYSSLSGYYKGTVPGAFWDTLNMKFDTINFEKLDTSYENAVDDLSTEIFIFSKNKITHIKGQSASLPQNVVQVYSWLLQSIKQMKFEKSKDSFNFPTIIEKSIPVPRR